MKFILLSSLVLLILTSCSSEEEKRQRVIMDEFTEVGNRIVRASFESLSGNLKAATKDSGIKNAIRFCNINALPLTDSLSKAFEAKIKRTSLKIRNPKNKPDSLEAYMLDLYLQIEKMKKPMVSKTLLARNNEVRYFAPIFLQGQCLTCHGTVGSTINDSTYAIIKKHYPNDEAINFNEGKLRGIWSINFGDINKLKKSETIAN